MQITNDQNEAEEQLCLYAKVLRSMGLNRDQIIIQIDDALDEVKKLDNVVVDGTAEDGTFQGDGELPPFALFSPDLQENIGGPYATREHAAAALTIMKQGIIRPFFQSMDSADRWNN